MFVDYVGSEERVLELAYAGKTNEQLPVTKMTRQDLLAIVGQGFQRVKNEIVSENKEDIY